MDDVDVVILSPLLYMGILVREELQRPHRESIVQVVILGSLIPPLTMGSTSLMSDSALFFLIRLDFTDHFGV